MTDNQIPTMQQVLKGFRQKHKLRQDELADLLDTSKQRLSQIEGGDSPTFDRIQDWATNPKFGVDIRELAYQLWIAYLNQQIQDSAAKLRVLQELVVQS